MKLDFVLIAACFGFVVLGWNAPGSMPLPEPVASTTEAAIETTVETVIEQPPVVVQEPAKVFEVPQEPPKRTLADSEAFNPDLVMYTKDWCLPCRRWKTTELDRIVKLGKRVLIMEAPEGLTIPHFVILGEGDKKIDHSGYLTTEEYRIKSAGL